MAKPLTSCCQSAGIWPQHARFVKKAITTDGVPDKIVIDKSGANLAGIQAVNAILKFAATGKIITIRQVKYLNNIVEQDHRFIKRQIKPMMGYKAFHSAAATLAGIEVAHMIRKNQLEYGNQSPYRTFASARRIVTPKHIDVCTLNETLLRSAKKPGRPKIEFFALDSRLETGVEALQASSFWATRNHLFTSMAAAVCWSFNITACGNKSKGTGSLFFFERRIEAFCKTRALSENRRLKPSFRHD